LHAVRAAAVSDREQLPLRGVDGDAGDLDQGTPSGGDTLVAERDRITETINDLIRSRDVLDDVIDAASGRQPGDLGGVRLPSESR
jgi:hypothetical protein